MHFMRKEFLIWMLGIVLVAAVGYGYAKQRDIHARYLQFQKNEKQVEAVRLEIEELKRRVEQAKQRVENMESDPVEIEATIRRIRKLTRDGEIVFHVESPPDNRGSDTTQEQSSTGN